MNRPLAITQRQIRAICEGAKQAGCAAIVEIGKVTIRLVPEDRVVLPQPDQPVDRKRDFHL